MASLALTTVDNPYDPFDEFDSWYRFDMDKGYDTCSYLDRIAMTSDQLTDVENEEEIERAIKEIIKYDHTGLYRAVDENDPKRKEKIKNSFE